MKNKLLSLALLLFATGLFAQDKDYDANADQIRNEIWGSPIAEFKVTKVPSELRNESAVVLARSYSSQWTSGVRFKMSLLGPGLRLHTQKAITFHERVKINDKVALEYFSTIEYQKKLDNSSWEFFTAKIRNTKNTFIGAKIVKSDGREVTVNTGEEVLLKNEEKDKKGKLAISDLQVGDILDYYVTYIEVSESGQGISYEDNENIFVMADEYPVLYYGIDFQLDKRVKAIYIYANGAPHFQEDHNKDGDLLLSLKLYHIPKLQSHLWTSVLRQYPYIEIGSAIITGLNQYDKRLSKAGSMFEGNKEVFGNRFFEYPDFNVPEKKTKDFFGSRKNLKNAPLDSVMKVLYDQWKFDVFCMYNGKELDDIRGLNYRNANSQFAAMRMSMMLTDMEIDHDILLMSSRKNCTLENSYNLSDFEAMIRINGSKHMYMCFDDAMTHFNEIPERYQGEKAVALHPKRHNAAKYTFTYSEATIPVLSSDQNRSEEQLHVSLQSDNMQRLKIERTVKETDGMRHDDQKLLIPVQDVDNEYTELVKGETLAKRLAESKATKKKLEDFNAAFAKEHTEEEKNFSNEIKSNYDVEPQQLLGYKIVNAALENSKPVFEFKETFALDNLVKKAGNNYIIDAGKLTGLFLRLDEKDKKRDLDIYMPAARSFKYVIVIDIPRGYAAQGMEALALNASNKTGAFSSSATVNGNELTITVNKVYQNNFEKASDWPLLVELIDTASAFNSKKILFEKQN